jgi:hypothetical protein
MKEKLVLKHRGDFDYFLLSRTENSEAVIASLNPDQWEQKLSKENCDKIFGVIDIDKLADEYFSDYYMDDYKQGLLDGFRNCYNYKAATKKYTEKDLIDFATFINGGNVNQEFELWKSLQQPTEIEVDIEMECKTGCVNFIYTDENSLCCGDKVPKLDENGCLILKQKP